MALFPRKRQCEVTFIEQHVVVIRGEKFHRHDYELQGIKRKLNSMDYKLDKLLKGGGTNDDSGMIQAIINKVDIIIEDIKKTV